MFCTNCGTQVADDAKFCANCGTALSPVSMPAAETQAAEAVAEDPFSEPGTDHEQIYAQYTPQPQPPKKKGGKTAIIMVAAIVLVAIFGIMMLFGGSDKDQPNNNTVINGSGSNTGDGIYAIVDELDALLADSFEEYTIEYDAEDDFIIISTWSDGIADATRYVSSNSDLYASWQNLRTNMCSMSDNAKDYVAASGYEETSVIVNLLNDLNQENVLLMCVDGYVFYDCTQE